MNNSQDNEKKFKIIILFCEYETEVIVMFKNKKMDIKIHLIERASI